MLNAIISKQDFDGLSGNDAGTAVAEHYKPMEGRDGFFMLDVGAIDGHGLEDNQGLKSALEKERSNVSTLQGQIKNFGDLDPVKAREALATIEKIGKGESTEEVKAQIEAVTNQLTEKHQGELGERDTKIGTLTEQLSTALIDSAATSAIAEAKGNAKLLLPLVKSQVKLQEDTIDGKSVKVVRVMNERGEVRVSPKTNNQGPMTVGELIEEMSKDKSLAGAFAGSGNSGSHVPGAPGSGNDDGNVIVLTETEGRDTKTYRAAKERAEKENKTIKIVPDNQ